MAVLSAYFFSVEKVCIYFSFQYCHSLMKRVYLQTNSVSNIYRRRYKKKLSHLGGRILLRRLFHVVCKVKYSVRLSTDVK